MSLPSVAVVILNYNGRNFLEKFLPSVIDSTYTNMKLVVADNASTDDSVLLLQNNFPSVDLLLLDKNYWFAEGYNRALAKVQADYYVLLNSDVEVTPGWLNPVIALMESDTTIAACQPKILSWYQKDFFEYAGAAGGWLDYLGYPFARGRVFETIEKDRQQFEDIQPIFWASGAAMFIRANLYHQCGGLDPYFFAHQEEVDLCWRLQLAGYQIMSCPSSVVYHVGGGTLPKGHSRKTFLNFRNNLVMLCKNLYWTEKLWKMPFRFALDAVFAWKCLLGGDAVSFIAVAKAHIAVICWWLGKRKHPSFSAKPMHQLQGVTNHSIVWAHFVQKKTLFAEIVEKKLG